MGIVLRLLVAAGLAVDAYVHWIFAPDMANPDATGIGGDTLFRGQAVVAALAAVLVLVLERWWTYAVAFLVAGSAVGALLFYHYFDPGALGPIPNMHDTTWYSEKVWCVVGEGIATVAALVGMLTVRASRRDPAPAGL
ncbi:hypothetical protein DPM19_11460 [Actinomadura craniellae]|uniref:Uncharacterized protein n=1 Tax=Actinomadura craniellae TaxID=2231787 RepID=A0A365H8N0_9ACTN|nr:hypothetical protein [Actinomadura craniellae]RAY15316.1 hypothetical protein DPM19_11460 [Actinomadura craniellae]